MTVGVHLDPHSRRGSPVGPTDTQSWFDRLRSRETSLRILQVSDGTAEGTTMVPWLILIGMTWYGVYVFRRSLKRTIGSDHDVVGEAERLLKGNPSRVWIRPIVATAITWGLISVVLTPVSIALAIWTGGLVIAGGAAATIRAFPDPTKIDDAEFELELRNLFEQYS
jgi:hypothetical protein